MGLLGLAVKGIGWLAKKATKKNVKRAVKAAAENMGPLVRSGARDAIVGTAGYWMGKRGASMPTQSYGPSGGQQMEPYQGGGAMVPQGSYALCNIKGHHMNKSSYFLKSGEFVEAGTKCVRNRRMNPLNGRAATKAISRIKGARKMLNRIERSLPKRKSASCGGRCSTARRK